jgi:hypothetical protein
MNHDLLVDIRREAIHALCVAQAREIISVDLFVQRLALVHEAPSPAAIDALVADLEPTGEAEAAYPAPYMPPATLGAAANSLRLSAIFSTTTRDGQWIVPRLLDLKAICGEIKLDLRDALFNSDIVEIDVNVLFGSILLTLPAGTRVENEATAIFGATKHKISPELGTEPNGLIVRITGELKFGELKIRERLPTELLPPKRKAKGWLARMVDSID